MDYNSPAFWLSYYRAQAAQSGHGLDGFHGSPYQRGAGLGSFFRSLFSMAVPVLKRVAQSTAKRVGKHALATVGHIAADVAGGKHFKEAAAARGKEGVASLLHEGADALKQSGSGLGIRPVKIRAKTAAPTAGRSYKRRTKGHVGSVAKRGRGGRWLRQDVFGPIR